MMSIWELRQFLESETPVWLVLMLVLFAVSYALLRARDEK